MNERSVVFVDDDETIRLAARQWFALSGIDMETFASPQAALDHVARQGADFAGVVITDVRMPGCDGIEVLTRIIAIDRTIPVILLTGHGDVPLAVEAMQRGAYDFMEKPFDPERVLAVTKRALALRELTLENRALRRRADERHLLESRLIGNSEVMAAVRRRVAAAAVRDVPVLVIGEPGTGKEVVARALHDLSPRAHRAFVTLACSQIPPSGYESDIFGHVAGYAANLATGTMPASAPAPGQRPLPGASEPGRSARPTAARCTWTR